MHAISQAIPNASQLIIGNSGQGIQLIEAPRINSYQKQADLISLLDIPFSVFFLNRESETQIANNTQLQALSVSSIADGVGISAWDVTTKEAAQNIIQHDKLVLKSNKMIVRDELYVSENGEQPYLSFKYPWYDNNYNLIGLFGIGILLDNNHTRLANCMNILIEKGLLFSSNHQSNLPGLISLNTYFTEKEKNIIALLIRGKTAREIGLILGRSRRTIESHIENLKIKTNSCNRSELIEKLMTI